MHLAIRHVPGVLAKGDEWSLAANFDLDFQLSDVDSDNDMDTSGDMFL